MTKNKHWGDYTNFELQQMSMESLIGIIMDFQMEDNFIIMTDSYKMTHHLLLPEGLQESYAYMEARGGDMPYSVMFGLQYYLKRYFCGVRITPEKIEEARQKNIAHFGFDCFNDKMWWHIWEKYGGRLPLDIKAVPEGTPVAVKNIMLSIKNIGDEFTAPLTNISETLLMKTWASNTVAAYARIIRVFMKRCHKLTSVLPEFLIDLMHHDFGYRGVNSEESGRILGAAALSSGFKGTDTLGAIKLAEKYYDEPMAGFSVIASEHSVHCSYGGREKEAESYGRIIERVKRECANVNPASGVIILSLVSDTYNIYNVVKRILPSLKHLFVGWKNNFGVPLKIVVRPDSWIPGKVIFGTNAYEGGFDYEASKIAIKCSEDMEISLDEAAGLIKKGVMRILMEEFGSSINEKGYETLDPGIGVLQGDGVQLKTVIEMLVKMIHLKYDTLNLIFGSGGKYLQAHERDDQKWATKVIHVKVNGENLDVQKCPITDSGKVSKKGYQKLKRTGNTWKDFETIGSSHPDFEATEDFLQHVFHLGDLLIDQSLAEIRERCDMVEEEFNINFNVGDILIPDIEKLAVV